MKRYILKLFPYLVCLTASGLFFITGMQFDTDIKGLLHGISGSLLAIPILYVIYDMAKEYSNKNLNKELFYYAKMQIDQDVLSIINQLMKLSLPYNDVSLSPQNIHLFLSKSQQRLIDQLRGNEYLGFQVFKSWMITEKNISNILENPFILQHLGNDQTISIINMLKAIRSISVVPANAKELYLSSGTTMKGFRVESGTSISNDNTEFPDRYLLLRDVGDDKYVVCDFGDFPKFQIENLLKVYKINQKYVAQVASSIFMFLECMNNWLEVSGNEFILDPKIYKIVPD